MHGCRDIYMRGYGHTCRCVSMCICTHTRTGHRHPRGDTWDPSPGHATRTHSRTPRPCGARDGVGGSGAVGQLAGRPGRVGQLPGRACIRLGVPGPVPGRPAGLARWRVAGAAAATAGGPVPDRQGRQGAPDAPASSPVGGPRAVSHDQVPLWPT